MDIGSVNIVSGSMAPNLLKGDRVFVYSTTPQLGDIIVFDGYNGNPYAKRLVAMGGDRICFNREDFVRENDPSRKHFGIYNLADYDDSSHTKYEMYE